MCVYIIGGFVALLAEYLIAIILLTDLHPSVKRFYIISGIFPPVINRRFFIDITDGLIRQ